MKTYDFEVILAAGTDMTEELADQLFEAGCDDGTPGVCCGVPVIGFSREADCLESAIRRPWPMSRKPAVLSSESRSSTTRRCCPPGRGSTTRLHFSATHRRPARILC